MKQDTKDLMLKNWEATVELMDPNLRELLAARGYQTNEEFLDAYLKLHETVYGVEFMI